MRKPAPLAAGVLLKKGQAVPMAGSHSRDEAAAVHPHPTPTADEARAKTRTADLEPLGFKVSPEFNHDFRRFAFENGYKLNELLFAAFDAFKKSRIRESVNS
ncbi:MAG: hypothetical protein JO133_03040 [Burkholderiaceae bacterium]|nr:hypothetical protein [Burkholderiaceae bacterium]